MAIVKDLNAHLHDADSVLARNTLSNHGFSRFFTSTHVEMTVNVTFSVIFCAHRAKC